MEHDFESNLEQYTLHHVFGRWWKVVLHIICLHYLYQLYLKDTYDFYIETGSDLVD